MKSETVSVGHIEIKNTELDSKINLEVLPVLPARNLVLFPGVLFPIHLIRPLSKRLAEIAEQNNIAVAIVCQRDPSVDNPKLEDLYDYGVIGKVMKVIPMPDDNALAMVMTYKEKIHIDGLSDSMVADSLCVKATLIKDRGVKKSEDLQMRIEMAASTIHEVSEFGDSQCVPAPPEKGKKDADPASVINALCVSAPVNVDARIEMLKCNSVRERLDRLMAALYVRKEEDELRQAIEEGTRQKMSERQRNAFLESQMDTIRQELYGEGSETTKLREKLDKAKVNEVTHNAITREIDKLEHLNPSSPDFQTQYSYVEAVLELPWGISTVEIADFKFAENELNATHFGLEKVKERILEQLAMRIHSPQSHAPIICLVGPPGVGKTSLGQSIAKALGRKFERVSLGGMHDESEIRGHRRTYIGAMPGRIIDAVRRAGSVNPIIMLDEIDKLGQDYKGNPSAALLEVLDPEQNVKFHDNYIDLDFDLSDVMFITTANTLSTVEAPLLDRMEVINLSGYSAQEKLQIAKQHLLPMLRKEMGLAEGECEISDAAISYITDNYTAESGVRQLQKKLAAVLRKYIRAKVANEQLTVPVMPESLRNLLGVETNSHDKYSTDKIPGVVTGLAWTAAGGEILFIEAVLTPGKGDGMLTLTGNLGDVMKESAAIAHRYVKAHAQELGIDAERLKMDLHIHVPEGAIPKDGSSAGITMTTAIVSALTERPVKERLAMTGEITLRGKVLPVGGIKEKILAAKRAGINEIILCKENQRNIEEIKAEYVEGMKFCYVASINEVLREALV
ncbi:MAG: endopeptidase La [Bacteroides sp.]|nr:endopeptidase La [Bacteroides sp.]MCM1380211.1 endopeptidase La [Bacteroides sp.]MCM1446131.1 endopeptidase La [Prevotella sp.]